MNHSICYSSISPGQVMYPFSLWWCLSCLVGGVVISFSTARMAFDHLFRIITPSRKPCYSRKIKDLIFGVSKNSWMLNRFCNGLELFYPFTSIWDSMVMEIQIWIFVVFFLKISSLLPEELYPFGVKTLFPRSSYTIRDDDIGGQGKD